MYEFIPKVSKGKISQVVPLLDKKLYRHKTSCLRAVAISHFEFIFRLEKYKKSYIANENFKKLPTIVSSQTEKNLTPVISSFFVFGVKA